MKVLLNGLETELTAAQGINIIKDGDRLRVITPDGVKTAVVVKNGDKTYVSVDGQVFEIEKFSSARQKTSHHGSGEGRAPMPGQIVEVLVKLGDTVSQGTTLIILEAMKMQQPIKADFDGVVTELQVKPGDQVNDGQLLVKVEKNSA